MIFSKLMLIAVGACVVNALPIVTVPDAQEDRLVDLDSPGSRVSIRFLNGDDLKAVLVKYTDNGVLKQLHINAKSDTASYAVDPTKEITIMSDYSPYRRRRPRHRRRPSPPPLLLPCRREEGICPRLKLTHAPRVQTAFWRKASSSFCNSSSTARCPT